MKICVYDILDYEEPILKTIKSEVQAQLVEIHEPLSLETLEAARGCDGVSVLGYSQSEINVALKDVNLDGLTLEQIIKAALKKMMKG